MDYDIKVPDFPKGEITSESFRIWGEELLDKGVTDKSFIILCEEFDFARFMRSIMFDGISVSKNNPVIVEAEFISLNSNGINVIAILK